MTQAPDIQALSGESMNLAEHNIEQLKQLFPNVFSEGKIDFEALKSELGEFTDTDNERYQFTWNGKEQAKRIATTPTLGTLRPASEESVNWDTTENIYIEGDNLEVLKLLQKSYFGKVKMIYIDPPYNTGKDFVYKDDFKDNLANYQRLTGQKDDKGNPLTTNTDSSGRYHSNWLNMMYPRLKLARNLLKDDGVIFISIDDNEIHNLRKICDEVFGEMNFIAEIIWKKRSTPPNDRIIGAQHEYILAFAKSENKALNLRTRTPEQLARYKNPDNHPKGPWMAGDLMANVKGGRYVNSLNYPIINPQTNKEHYPSSNGNWRFNQERMKELINNNEIYFGENGDGRPKLKRFLSEVKSGITWTTLWDFAPLNTIASSEMTEIFGNLTTFENPKPTGLIKYLIEAGLKNDEVVLDFFSGSATTADAIIQLNTKDDGKRKFILVQIPEQTPQKSEAYKAGYETIAEIGKERIRRAAKKIKEEHPDTQADLGFKVFKLDTSNIKKWQPNLDDLETDLLSAVDNILPDRTSQDLLFEVLIKYGLPLTLPIEQINIQNNGQTYQAWNVANNALIACFDENLTIEAVQAIAALSTPENPVLRVVFRDTSFQNDITKTNSIQRLKQAGIEDVLSI